MISTGYFVSGAKKNVKARMRVGLYYIVKRLQITPFDGDHFKNKMLEKLFCCLFFIKTALTHLVGFIEFRCGYKPTSCFFVMPYFIILLSFQLEYFSPILLPPFFFSFYFIKLLSPSTTGSKLILYGFRCPL